MFDENGLLRAIGQTLSMKHRHVTLTKDNRDVQDALDGFSIEKIIIPPIKQAMMFPRMMGAAAERYLF